MHVISPYRLMCVVTVCGTVQAAGDASNDTFFCLRFSVYFFCAYQMQAGKAVVY